MCSEFESSLASLVYFACCILKVTSDNVCDYCRLETLSTLTELNGPMSIPENLFPFPKLLDTDFSWIFQC